MSVLSQIKLDKLYSVSLSSNDISHNDIHNLRIDITDTDDIVSTVMGDEYGLEDSHWYKWTVTEGDNQGTWPKRFAKEYRKVYGKKIDPQLNSIIGEKLRKYVNVEPKTYHLAFTHYADWEPGSFQESEDSCWWQSYNGSREGLIEHDGLAVLWYSSREEFLLNHRKHGIGRCWLWDAPSYAFVFNGYSVGRISLANMADVISSIVGLPYRRVETTEEGETGVYINGQVGYAIARKKVLDILVDTYLDLKFSNGQDRCDDGEYYCQVCEGEIHEDETYDSPIGYLCEYCFSERYTHCEKCDDTVDAETTEKVKNGRWDEYWCDYCTSSYAYCCDDCGRYSTEHTTEVENCDNVCGGCLNDYYYYCQKCNIYTKESPDGEHCESCYEEEKENEEDGDKN